VIGFEVWWVSVCEGDLFRRKRDGCNDRRLENKWGVKLDRT